MNAPADGDYPGIVSHLNPVGRQGWFTVELDRAAVNKGYLEQVLGLTL